MTKFGDFFEGSDVSEQVKYRKMQREKELLTRKYDAQQKREGLANDIRDLRKKTGGQGFFGRIQSGAGRVGKGLHGFGEGFKRADAGAQKFSDFLSGPPQRQSKRKSKGRRNNVDDYFNMGGW